MILGLRSFIKRAQSFSMVRPGGVYFPTSTLMYFKINQHRSLTLVFRSDGAFSRVHGFGL